MTDIQVKYWNLIEDIRHNRNVEGETKRHNVETERQGVVQLDETHRHNFESETIGYYQAQAAQTQAWAAVRNAATNERRQTLAENQFRLIDLPIARAEQTLKGTQAELNRAKKNEADANVEVAKSKDTQQKADARLKTAQAAKAEAEAEVAKVTAGSAAASSFTKALGDTVSLGLTLAKLVQMVGTLA